jgi:hypothetical protein
VLENQGLSAVAFFEATAFIILLVLFVLLRRDHPTRFLKTWTIGWTILTVKALLELTQVTLGVPQLRLPRVLLWLSSTLYSKSVFQQQRRPRRGGIPLAAFVAVLRFSMLSLVRPWELHTSVGSLHPSWPLPTLPRDGCCGDPAKDRWPWRQIDYGTIFLSGLNGIDRLLWLQSPLFLLRLSFDHLLLFPRGLRWWCWFSRAHVRTDELNDKPAKSSLLTEAPAPRHFRCGKCSIGRWSTWLAARVSHGIVRLQKVPEPRDAGGLLRWLRDHYLRHTTKFLQANPGAACLERRILVDEDRRRA